MERSVEFRDAPAAPGALPRFVVGMSRGGTTWMLASLNAHPRLAGFGESDFWGRSFVDPLPDGTYDAARLLRVRRALRANPLNSTIGACGPGWFQHVSTADIPRIVDACFDAIEPPIRPGAVFSRFATELARAEGKDGWVEKTPQSLNQIGRILRELPGARFVVMLRDPYGFMLSYKHQKDRGPSERRERFERLYHPIGCAFVWRTYLRNAWRAKALHPDQVLLVYQEEMSQPRDVLRRVQEFLLIEPVMELEGMAEDTNTSFAQGPRPELDGADVFWMNLVARREISSGRFERLASAIDLPAIFHSLWTLPAWLAFMLGHMRRTSENALGYLWRWLRAR